MPSTSQIEDEEAKKVIRKLYDDFKGIDKICEETGESRYRVTKLLMQEGLYRFKDQKGSKYKEVLCFKDTLSDQWSDNEMHYGIKNLGSNLKYTLDSLHPDELNLIKKDEK